MHLSICLSKSPVSVSTGSPEVGIMAEFILWGLTASPYQLKMQSLLDYTGHRWQRWPQQGGRWAVLTMARRLQIAKKRGTVRRFPQNPNELDEYPGVPYYTRDGKCFYYDSSSLALHLDQHTDRQNPALVPDDPVLAFLCRLIDEAFDEFGLYMVHHMRWVGSARSTPMGEMTAREMRPLLPPGAAALVARHLYRRQSRRCPYLFSVAPQGIDLGVAPGRTPPPRSGFPPTHELLESAWRDYLAAMEEVLAQRPYLLGERFSLADASAYGQLGMNLVDGDATRLLQELAPRTYRWLRNIEAGRHAGGEGELTPTEYLQPLLRAIDSTFIPLMVQNSAAYDEALARGETVFNEAAFDRHRALYDGELMGWPFRAVVKTFQVSVWRELSRQWLAIGGADRETLLSVLPAATVTALDETGGPG